MERNSAYCLEVKSLFYSRLKIKRRDALSVDISMH